ncbi:hypothetical protein G7K_3720-t1 [Saitoella complicata NRRL Y-17804]|uniref:Uncharacterized protein n=1 Tax=Saitoella complicata (strain BCRC 22490 / CBS 7301 / JCM 7358 / NBRC 10748 / NRRL Y-17804) TaxID=698492 RepID=A0A0E9NIR7_SAICN|nr:hypothetical protein G7K_3720-t1 [Saitoella complicata NRRL Y-17804]
MRFKGWDAEGEAEGVDLVSHGVGGREHLDERGLSKGTNVYYIGHRRAPDDDTKPPESNSNNFTQAPMIVYP